MLLQIDTTCGQFLSQRPWFPSLRGYVYIRNEMMDLVLTSYFRGTKEDKGHTLGALICPKQVPLIFSQGYNPYLCTESHQTV